MKPFKQTTKPVSVEFFSIIDDGGVKSIHLHGYTYESDDCWVNLEACGIIIPLSEFIEGYAADEDGLYVDSLYEEAKQYEDDYDADGIVHAINHYYSEIVFGCNGSPSGDGAPDGILDFGEITLETPEGSYATTPDY